MKKAARGSQGRSIALLALVWVVAIGCAPLRSDPVLDDAGGAGGTTDRDGGLAAPDGPRERDAAAQTDVALQIDAAAPPPSPAADAQAAPACGVRDGVCLMGCPPAALDPDCPATANPPKLERGMACARADVCASGFCADGVCCDGACGSACQSCAQAGRAGSCLPLFNEPDPGQCDEAGEVCTTVSSCAAIDQRTEGATAGISIYAVGATAAQLVTVGRAGRIAGVRFRVECRVGGSMVVQVQNVSNNLPTEGALASEVIAHDGLAAQKQNEQMIAFGQPPRVAAGQKIAVTARIVGAACTFQNTNDAYPAGYSLVRSPEDGTWYPDEEDDIFFQTLMLP
jgi:hypothetical protein